MRTLFLSLILLLAAAAVSPAAERGFLTKTGDSFPVIKGTAADGTSFSSEGRVAVIHVFACDSEVCGESLPVVEEFIWQPLRHEELQVVGIGRDATQQMVTELAAEKGITFPLLPDENRAWAKKFAENGDGVPRTIVTDRDGNIAWQHAGWSTGREAELRRVVDAVLAGRQVPSARARGGNIGGPPRQGDWVGKEAPEVFVEEWITTEPASTEGKYTMIEFWATWCGPCRVVMPHLEEISKDHADKLVIKSLSNEPPATVKRYVEKEGYTYPIGTDTQARTIQTVGVRGIPHGLIVNPEGIVVWQGHPGEFMGDDGEKKLEALLGGGTAAGG